MILLGHHFSSAGISPSSSKVEAISQFPTFDSMKKLHQFLGLINFFQQFLPSSTQIVKLLMDILTNIKNCDIILSEPPLAAFHKIKSILSCTEEGRPWPTVIGLTGKNTWPYQVHGETVITPVFP